MNGTSERRKQLVTNRIDRYNNDFLGRKWRFWSLMESEDLFLSLPSIPDKNDEYDDRAGILFLFVLSRRHKFCLHEKKGAYLKKFKNS